MVKKNFDFAPGLRNQEFKRGLAGWLFLRFLSWLQLDGGGCSSHLCWGLKMAHWLVALQAGCQLGVSRTLTAHLHVLFMWASTAWRLGLEWERPRREHSKNGWSCKISSDLEVLPCLFLPMLLTKQTTFNGRRIRLQTSRTQAVEKPLSCLICHSCVLLEKEWLAFNCL